ncbi:MAG: hypothetical protein MPI95_03235 [Nitrosopumilus sp.]|nr:hypothetical protein [Nitrosopumilus sp.]MDA7943317.1 hypothetical protein [Nitrosopumilus sp.]MDA7945700.1 hypothetical protein [Nitrosopumilus sp.]MDA7952283.1 hypothetical protein [Nitrosopumilus sp.]MDA7953941.1 hypothetical protein [Nitrosopumilus sp.]
MRQRVLFHNSIDVWIGLCEERGAGWGDPDGYRGFISYLRERDLGLKSFGLCAHDAGSEDARSRLADELAKSPDDPSSRVYTIRLTDGALGVIRGFEAPAT